jgi:hypothetical protein
MGYPTITLSLKWLTSCPDESNSFIDLCSLASELSQQFSTKHITKVLILVLKLILSYGKHCLTV